MSSLTLVERGRRRGLVRNDRAQATVENLVFALGCVKIGVGLGEILAPRTMSRWVGQPRMPLLRQLNGLRQVVTGVGILTQTRPMDGVRVGAVLGTAGLVAGSLGRRSLERAGFTIVALVGAAALGVIVARELRAHHGV
jgi:hypothetical protein